ncbi:MAG TPA: DUF1499 domain-containing protein [Usitatibacter sp.]|nr:DUF1499 domain-containing protein [Usitatibacter sp.]
MSMGRARAAVFALALLALLMLALSGPGTRMGWWDWRTGLTILTWAAYIGIAAALLAAVLVLMLAVPRWRARPWTPILALIVALVAIAPPLIFLSRAKAVPPIHDITTDLAEPPAFVALADARGKAPNGVAYEGAAAAEGQQRAYADIKPKVLTMPPREAVQRAIDAARALGWEVVSSDATTGRVEATATTKWFGFQDDVVVRVRPEGTGSRVDVRSASRVGESDVGANAARVREFLAKLT